MISSKHIWIINPFDQLPNESDIPLRYWSLSKKLASYGYHVIWWSSDFSHKNKIKRNFCGDTDGFSIKLIKTPPYLKNIGIDRIISHKTFSKNFYDEAIKGIKNKDLEIPFRIVTSLPPLWITDSVFEIRDYINNKIYNDAKKSNLSPKVFCRVIVDIMDAWPEAFYRIFPKKLKNFIAPILLSSFHRSAKIAYNRADKISAVGQSYLEIAKKYLYKNQYKSKPKYLCYHGVDLGRFKYNLIIKRLNDYKRLNNKKIIKHKRLKESNNIDKRHLKIVHVGSMNSGYDVQTIIKFANEWNDKNKIPIQIHFAGKGDQFANIEKKSKKLGLIQSANFKNKKSQIIFHGYIKNDYIKKLLLSSDIAIVSNRSDTLVACPYKAGEYAGAGLAIISCLEGEFNKMIKFWNAGLSYKEGNALSLYNAINKYANDFDLLIEHSFNARKMAENLFDRNKTYKNFSEFIINDI